MTTITIDTPVHLEKTHFSDALEAAYALMWTHIVQNNGSVDKILEEYHAWKNVVTMPDDIENIEQFSSFISKHAA